MATLEERFSGAGDAIGLCDICPQRPLFYSDMSEDGGNLIHPSWYYAGREAAAICLRAQQIEAGQEPTYGKVVNCPNGRQLLF